MMLSKRNRSWLVLTLVVAMIAMAVAPAHVLACADLGVLASIHQPVPQAVCATTGLPGPCCCGADAAKQAPGHSGCSLHASDCCNCSMQAPPVAPAPLKAAAGNLSAAVIAVPQRRLALDLPQQVQRGLPSASLGCPRSPYCSSTPSRAPPAC